MKLLSEKINSVAESVAKFSDSVLSRNNIHSLERITIAVSVLSFFAHIIVIAVVTAGFVDIPGIQPGNYLKAVATPFSFILVFEVFQLLISIRDSITISLGKQFQVMSLVIIRNVFKDMGNLGSLQSFDQNTTLVLAIGLYILTGLAIFGLSGVYFYFVHKLRKIDKCEEGEINIIRSLEKITALGLVLFFVVYTLFYIFGVDNLLGTAVQFSGFNLDGLFTAIFTAMIFADIFILLVYFIYNDSYNTIFRNASFVIASILIRLGLTTNVFWDKTFIISGMVLGIVTLVIYYYIRKYEINNKISLSDLF